MSTAPGGLHGPRARTLTCARGIKGNPVAYHVHPKMSSAVTQALAFAGGMDDRELDKYLGSLSPLWLQALQRLSKAHNESLLSARVEKWCTEHRARPVEATVPNSSTIAPPVPDGKDSAPPSAPATAPVPACETRTAADATTDAECPANPKSACLSLWVYVPPLARIWSAPGVLWAHAPSRPRIPKWFVGLMFVLTSCAVLLFLVGLAGGPALEAIPVLSSNSTGPDKTTNTTNGTSVVVRMAANQVVAISDGLRQFLQLWCTADIKVAVVSLAALYQPLMGAAYKHINVRAHQPRRPRPNRETNNDDYSRWVGLFALAGLALYVFATTVIPIP